MRLPANWALRRGQVKATGHEPRTSHEQGAKEDQDGAGVQRSRQHHSESRDEEGQSDDEGASRKKSRAPSSHGRKYAVMPSRSRPSAVRTRSSTRVSAVSGTSVGLPTEIRRARLWLTLEIGAKEPLVRGLSGETGEQ